MRTAVALLLLAACSRSPDPAALESQFELMKRANVSSLELCGKAREVADAWLQMENDLEYRLWRATANSHCLQDQLDGLRP